MKGEISHKDKNYSLTNIDNYKPNIECSLGEVTKKYGDLLIEYLNFISENIQVKNKCFSQFIIIRGLDTITNVFNNIFYYTKNIDLTYFHCQKSFYFYVEFVTQISEDDKITVGDNELIIDDNQLQDILELNKMPEVKLDPVSQTSDLDLESAI